MGQEQCLVCNGVGSIPCPECGGKGKVGGILGVGAKECYGCDGEGRLPCTECQGTGIADAEEAAGEALAADAPDVEVPLEVVDEVPADGEEPEEPEDLQQKLLERVGRPVVDMAALEAMVQERESQAPPPPPAAEASPSSPAPSPPPLPPRTAPPAGVGPRAATAPPPVAPEAATTPPPVASEAAPSPPVASPPPPAMAPAPAQPTSKRPEKPSKSLSRSGKGPRGKGSDRSRSRRMGAPKVGLRGPSSAKGTPSKGAAADPSAPDKVGAGKKTVGAAKGPAGPRAASKPRLSKKVDRRAPPLDDPEDATIDTSTPPAGTGEGAENDKTIDMPAPPGVFAGNGGDVEEKAKGERPAKGSVPPPSELGFGTPDAPSGKRTGPARTTPTRGRRGSKKGSGEIIDAPTVEEEVPPALRPGAAEAGPPAELFEDEDTQVDVVDSSKAPASVDGSDLEDTLTPLRTALEAAGRDPRDAKGLVASHSSGVTAHGLVALALARRVYEELTSAGREKHQDALARLCATEANERLSRGDGPGAGTLVDRAIVIWEGFSEAGQKGHEADLARAYVTKAQCVHAVDVTSRVALYDRAMQLHEALADGDAPGSKVDLARTLMAKGVALGYLGDPGSASGAFDRAATLWLQLVQSGEGEYDDDLARAYMNKGVALEQLGDMDKAADLYSLAIRLWRPLVDSSRFPDLAGDLGWTLAYSAAALKSLSQIQQAKQDAREAVAILESEVSRTARSDLRDVLAWARSELSSLL